MLARIFVKLIRVYQVALSAFLGNRCRFYPSCSEYTIEAIQVHGPIKGVGLGAARICRCHPFHEGGYDPVPPAEKNSPLAPDTNQTVNKVMP